MIEFNKIEAWEWECPICGMTNIENNDPIDGYCVECSNCGSILSISD